MGKEESGKCGGGYSPKIFDGHFLELKRRWLGKHLKGAGVIADQHFEWGTKNLKKVTFFTALHKKERKAKKERKETDQNSGGEGDSDLGDEVEEDNEDMVDFETFTRDQDTYNKALYKLRARVEMAFGEAKTLFAVLRDTWKESDH